MASRTSSRDSESSESPPLSRRDTQAKSETSRVNRSFSGRAKKIWQKTGLDQPTILLMIK